MERWAGRVALVTGASVGIGAAIVQQLVQNGMKVVGCSRNIDNIQVSYLYLLSSFILYTQHVHADVSTTDLYVWTCYCTCRSRAENIFR